MSKMSDLDIEIQDQLVQGTDPVQVAERLRIPLEWVTATLEYMMESDEPDLTVPEEA
jgi:hypothetical protein